MRKHNTRARRNQHGAHTMQEHHAPAAKAEMFAFGEPEEVLSARDIWGLFGCELAGAWYEPPVPFDGLARSFRANPHHETALRIKRNFLVRLFRPHRIMSKATFSAWVLDYLVFGNAFLERRKAITGNTLTLKHALAKYVRRKSDLVNYVQLPTGYNLTLDYVAWQPHEFPEGSVFHLIEPDLNQEVYGMPEYLSALQSLWLNESATLFRRKYFKNGSHAGYILYATDAQFTEEDVQALRDKLRQSKGPGNFRNLLLYAPGGKKDGIQLLPIGEVAARDEFSNIKNVSRDDVLVAHRVPPQLLGVVPQNSGGFGNIKDATQAFLVNEIVHIQDRLQEVNAWAGEEVVTFEPMSVILDQLGAVSLSTGDKLAKALRDALA